MEILSAQDRAAVSACCCALPATPYPQVEYKSLAGVAYLAWQVYSGGTFYRTKRTDYSGGGFLQYSESQAFSCWFGYRPDGDVSISETVFTEGTPRTGTPTTTNLDPITVDTAREDAYAALLAALEWDNEDWANLYETGNYPLYHYRHDHTPSYWSDLVLTVGFCRYRVGLPATEDFPHDERSYYEIEWDEYLVTSDWQDWYWGGKVGDEPGTPEFVASRSWTWSGNEAVVWSDWIDYPEPEPSPYGEAPRLTLANMRFKCWRSTALGVAPTLAENYPVIEASP